MENRFPELYEMELQEIFQGHRRFNQRLLFETRGLKEEFSDILQRMYKAVTAPVQRFHFSEDGKDYDYCIIEHVDCGKNSFMSPVLILVTYNDNGCFKNKGAYAIPHSQYNIKTGTLQNVHFHYHCRGNEIERSDFMETMWHELHHAYRDYCVLKTNCAEYPEGYLQKTFKVDSPKLTEKGKAFADRILYFTNYDELNAYASMNLQYVRDHPGMTRENYRDSLDDNPAYYPVTELQKIKAFFERSHDDRNLNAIVCYLQGALYRNNKRYRSRDDAHRRLYGRVCRALMFAEKQFYKTLERAFEITFPQKYL